MNSAIPGFVAWPILVFTAAVSGLRYALCNTRLWDKYLNHILALLLSFNLLREKSVEYCLASHHILAVTTTQVLSLLPGNFVFIEFLGFATLWSGSSPQATIRQHRYHRLVGIVLFPIMFLALDRIRPTVQGLWESHGWDTFLLVLLVFPIVPCLAAFQMLRLGLREWTRPNVERQERIIAAGLIAIATAILASCPVSLIYPTISEYWPLGVAGLISALAAVPVVRTLLARAGLDEISQSWRALQPLKAALAAAVPRTVFDLPTTHVRRKTTLELHQSVVQIRDGILGLRPYLREITRDEAERFFHRYAVPTDQRDAAVQALQIAEAIRGKENANETWRGPKPLRMGSTIRGYGSTSLEQEATALVRVCKWWPSALAATHLEYPPIG